MRRREYEATIKASKKRWERIAKDADALSLTDCRLCDAFLCGTGSNECRECPVFVMTGARCAKLPAYCLYMDSPSGSAEESEAAKEIARLHDEIISYDEWKERKKNA